MKYLARTGLLFLMLASTVLVLPSALVSMAAAIPLIGSAIIFRWPDDPIEALFWIGFWPVKAVEPLMDRLELSAEM